MADFFAFPLFASLKRPDAYHHPRPSRGEFVWLSVLTLHPEILANPRQLKIGFDPKSLFLYRHPTKICGRRSDLIKRFNFLPEFVPSDLRGHG